jgi:DNA sulfur modification protein DndB
MKIPAIRGKIGNTWYYITNLTFQQIKDLVKRVDSELYTSNSLKEQIQRSLTNNYIQIKDYILNSEDHFLGGLVLAVYDGEPKWTEVRYEIDDEAFYNIGLLELSGEEKIFPVDGQHRVEGIKVALHRQPNIASETISVMLIGHTNTPEGRERSRRIFSTLNRYVKPVRLGDIIALDEDDIVAIVTRDLLERYPLFIGNRIKAINTKSIPTNDKSSFTTLMTLYDCHLVLFQVFISSIEHKRYTQAQLKNYLKNRPSDSVIKEFTDYLISFWDTIRRHCGEVDNFIKSNSNVAAAEMRSNVTGGNILFRPIGLFPFIDAVTKIRLNSEYTYDTIIQRYSFMNRIVSQEPWIKILWNPIENKMIMKNQALVKYILINMFDPTLLNKRDKQEMCSKYASIFNISPQEAEQRISVYKI